MIPVRRLRSGLPSNGERRAADGLALHQDREVSETGQAPLLEQIFPPACLAWLVRPARQRFERQYFRLDYAVDRDCDIEFLVLRSQPFADTGFERLPRAVRRHCETVERTAGPEIPRQFNEHALGDLLSIVAPGIENRFRLENRDVRRMCDDAVEGDIAGGFVKIAGGGGKIRESIETLREFREVRGPR